MSQPHSTLYAPLTPGRTVRAIVEHTPALVDEAWCRRLLDSALQALDQGGIDGGPSPNITPDSVKLLDDGSVLHIDTTAPQDELAESGAQLYALALLTHYAISAERPPEGPLGPRLLDGYSEQLCKGLDSCLGPNRRLRPKTSADMRSLLGIAADLPLPAVSATPPRIAQPQPQPSLATTAAMAVAATPVTALPTDAGTVSTTASATASATACATAPDSAPTVASLATFQMWPTETTQARATHSGLIGGALLALAGAGAMLTAYFPQYVPSALSQLLPAPATAAAAAAPAMVVDGTTYLLDIHPSGSVEIDGQAVGATPPLQRISLAPGPHTIRILHAASAPYVATVTAGTEATATLSHDFTPPVTAEPAN